MARPSPSYRGYRFPPEIISHAVWLRTLPPDRAEVTKLILGKHVMRELDRLTRRTKSP